MKIARNFGLAMAVGSLAVSGVAQAETRSSAAVPSYTPVAPQSIARGSAEPAAEQDMRGSSGILLILAILAILAGIAIAVGGSNGVDSPG